MLLRIGSLTLTGNVLLAPMAGYCHLPFRLLVRKCGGAALAFTDLLNAEGVVRETCHTLRLAQTCAEDYPLAMQLVGADPRRMAEAAKWAVDHGAAVVDINMGCPAPKIVRLGQGARLLCDTDLAVRIAAEVVRAVPHTPVTVKMRLGWDDGHIVAPELARRMEQEGVAAVTVHGRTAAMKFGGTCRLEGIAAVVEAVRGIPVIGNGDVRTPEDARRMIERTGCAGVMVGRAALGAPWLLRHIDAFLRDGTLLPQPAPEEKCRLMREHFENACRLRGEEWAVREFRQRITWYGKHLGPCRDLRQRMRSIVSRADFETALSWFLESRHACQRG